MIRRLVALALTVSAAVALPPSVRADEPLRSGTITGWGYTWPAMFSGEARNCQWNEWYLADGVGGANPECRAWLESGCDPALAGREPAVTASIQDVSDLADGATARLFNWSAPPETDYGGVVLQLWRTDCTEIAGSEWRSLRRRWPSWANEFSARFVIPSDAAWMTVTTNDTAAVRWTLT